jgi:GDP-L-fucose synthase
MVRRCYEAKLRGDSEIVMWGDGSPLRDFVYAGDVAKTILWFIDNYNSSEPVNISSGTETSIKELAETIKNKMSWDGEIKWDVQKPNGQLVKVFDIKKLNGLGLSCNTSLVDGLDKTIKWLERNYATRGDGLRL